MRAAEPATSPRQEYLHHCSLADMFKTSIQDNVYFSRTAVGQADSRQKEGGYMEVMICSAYKQAR
eukprot:scaffold82665_cov33-Prasinocladus_malaysianus.AAC.2